MVLSKIHWRVTLPLWVFGYNWDMEEREERRRPVSKDGTKGAWGEWLGMCWRDTLFLFYTPNVSIFGRAPLFIPKGASPSFSSPFSLIYKVLSFPYLLFVPNKPQHASLRVKFPCTFKLLTSTNCSNIFCTFHLNVLHAQKYLQEPSGLWRVG